MITRQQAIERLDSVARELDCLKTDLEQGWRGETSEEATQAFLEKCGGWEDSRSVDQIIADIYGARTDTDRGAAIFAGNRS